MSFLYYLILCSNSIPFVSTTCYPMALLSTGFVAFRRLSSSFCFIFSSLVFFLSFSDRLLVLSSPVCLVLSCHILSCRILSCPVLSCPVLSCRILSCPVVSCPVMWCLVVSCPVLLCPVLFCPVLCYPILSCCILSCPILSCPVLRYAVPFCPVLLCPVLFCAVLICMLDVIVRFQEQVPEFGSLVSNYILTHIDPLVNRCVLSLSCISCPVLSCPILSCPVLLSDIRIHLQSQGGLPSESYTADAISANTKLKKTHFTYAY